MSNGLPHGIRSRLLRGGVLWLIWSTFGYACVLWGASPRSEAERAILRGVNSGEGADFGSLPLSARWVDGQFLSRLVAGEIPGVHFHHGGIQLKHVLVDGPFDISGQDVRVAFNCQICEFLGDVDMSDVHFLHDLSFQESRFHSSANLNHARLDGNLNIRWVQFDGSVDFSAVQVAGSIYATGFHVNTNGEQASFDHIKAGTLAEFTNLELNGPITLEEADLNELRLGSDEELCPSCGTGEWAPQIDLEGTTIRRDLLIREIDVDELNAPNLAVLGRTGLEHVTINDSVDLRGAQLHYVEFSSDVTWPAPESSDSDADIQLDGISLSQVEVQDVRNLAGAGKSQYSSQSDGIYRDLVKNWADKAVYTARPYQQLERAFSEAGSPELANFVFKSMKVHERRSGNLSFLATVQSFISWFLIGYGREPQYALYWSSLVVVVGYFVFKRRTSVQAKRREDEGKTYYPFWYSFVLFLPISTLPDSDTWAPEQLRWQVRWWARLHAMLGWILIPIGLAAISGLIPGK